MGFFDDVLGFEAFNLKDMWGKVKDDPERLLLGAADPWSSKMWGGILGKDYEPIVDQMGGAYGGHTISAFGNTDGGVYERARQAGIDVDAGAGVHDLAHVVSAIYGGQGLMNIGGAGGAPTTGGSDLGLFSNGGVNGMTGVGEGNVGLLARSGAIPGGAGMGSATAAPTGMNALGMQDYMKMAQGMGGGGQQSPQPSAPAPQMAPQNTLALQAQIQRQRRAQELRRKLNRTPQENRELRELTQTGLLG